MTSPRGAYLIVLVAKRRVEGEFYSEAVYLSETECYR